MAQANNNEIAMIVEWIGFTAAESATIASEIGFDLKELQALQAKDMKTLSESFAKRSVAPITFGLRRAKLMEDMVNWAKDWGRIGEEITLDGLDEAQFLAELLVARQRQEARVSNADTADSRAKEASPGKLTGPTIWEAWSNKLFNYLSILTGSMSIPLIYVIREHVEGFLETDEDDENFERQAIVKCPHERPLFREDSRQVHTIIQSFCIGEESEAWIKPIRRKEDGALDLEALCNHYRGAGNTTRRIADAERLRDQLHYKSESAMPFERFLTKCKDMFTMFSDSKEPYTESQKLRFLLERCEGAAGLQAMLGAITADSTIDPNKYTFDSTANALATVIKPRTKGRSLSALTTGSSSGDKSEIMRDGKIFTGHYENPKSIHPDNWKLVLAEREKKKGGKKNGKKSVTWHQNKSENQKRQIKALQAKLSSLKRSKSSSDDEGDGTEEPPADSAGNAFGGRSEMAKKKKKD